MREVWVGPDPTALAHEAARRFTQAAGQTAAVTGRCTVALAGGSTPAALYQLLATEAYREKIDWSRLLVFFGDERCVPPDHSDSNYRLVRESLLAHVPLPEANIYRMEGEADPQQAAYRYQDKLRRVFNVVNDDMPVFDLVLLGMGEDGHTASLFPGQPALFAADWVVHSPVPGYVRPQVDRLTLTLPVFNAARQVLFLVSGSRKAEAVSRVFASTAPAEALPAAHVAPGQGRLAWLLDRAAASRLPGRAEEAG